MIFIVHLFKTAVLYFLSRTPSKLKKKERKKTRVSRKNRTKHCKRLQEINNFPFLKTLQFEFSSLKKRDTAAAKRKAAEGDTGEKAEKLKTEENDAKSDNEKESEKKKSASKKSTVTDSTNESDDKKGTESTEEKTEATVEGDEAQVDKSTDNEDEDKKGDDKEKRKKFVRLWCVHCRIESATFKVRRRRRRRRKIYQKYARTTDFIRYFILSLLSKDYNNHIHSRSHKLVLGRYGLKQKTRLARMRLAQRNAQRQLEKDLKDAEKLTPQFCMLCRLNYRSPKEEHQASEAHRKMKEFLMPYCETCSMSFKSPMSYEIHRCSVEHLRVNYFKQYLNRFSFFFQLHQRKHSSVFDSEKPTKVKRVTLKKAKSCKLIWRTF